MSAREVFSTPSSTFGPKNLLQKPYYDGKRNEDITDKFPNGEEIVTKLTVFCLFVWITTFGLSEYARCRCLRLMARKKKGREEGREKRREGKTEGKKGG